MLPTIATVLETILLSREGIAQPDILDLEAWLLPCLPLPCSSATLAEYGEPFSEGR